MPIPPLCQIALVFARYANLTHGGGSATAATMHRELVEKRHWLTETPHINGLAIHLESDGTHLFAHRAAKCRWCAIVTERSGASMDVGPAGIVDYFAT
jgi:hypothetical protein